MPEALYALRLPPGQEDAYRRFGAVAREQRERFAASRRRFGITRHASWLAWVDGAPISLLLLTSPDLARTAAAMIGSDDEFDVGWREAAQALWGEQLWDGSTAFDVEVDLGEEDVEAVGQFLAGSRRIGDGEALPTLDGLDGLGLDRLLVTRQGDLLHTYASGDVAGLLDHGQGSPAWPLLAALGALPLPEPVIAWTDRPG